MDQDTSQGSSTTRALLERARSGDSKEALAELFSRHRYRLVSMIELRLSPTLRVRVDPTDVLQDAFLTASKRFSEFLENPEVPFFVWLRFLTRQTIAEIHRHHIGVQARDPRREVSLQLEPSPEASTVALAEQLLGSFTTPSEFVARTEAKAQLEAALNGMKSSEREILCLRHFEELTNAEAAAELGIRPSAASKRYVRAVSRLKGLLASRGFRSGIL